MIAYDLDGVISADVDWDKEFGIDQFLNNRDNVCPLFIPQGSFCIITARPPVDEDRTMYWLKKHDINPEYIKFGIYSIPVQESFEKEVEDIHTLCQDGAIRHKAECIDKDSNITIFIESNKEQVEGICNSIKRSDVKVIHFESWLVSHINSIYKN